MDLDEWEFLPDDGFLDFHEDGGQKKFSRQHGSGPKGVFNMNYFICPSPNSRKNSRVSNQLVPVPIQLDPPIGTAPDDEVVKEVTKVPIEISIVPSPISEKIKSPNLGATTEADQDSVSQVFFKKMKENEFVDMKMDSPKSGSRGIMPQTFQFEDKSEAIENKNGPKIKVEKDNLDSDTKEDHQVSWEEKSGGLNMWRWGLTGIGGLCSIGVAAAATICILIFGTHQRNKQHQHNQKLRFQIYSDDKRIKQVVHRATKLNEAISAVRGVPLTRAQITFGGYYDGL